jgi:hypothetical protein
MSAKQTDQLETLLANNSEYIRLLVNQAWNDLYITSDADTPEAHAFACQQINKAFQSLSALRDIVGKEEVAA